MVKILIDIGCFNAKTNSETFKLLKRKRDKWHGYMIEPNPHMEDDIKRNLSGLSYSYHQLGISDEDGEADFYLGKYGFMDRRNPRQVDKCMRSSLCNDKDYVKEHLTDHSITIKTQRLKTFILENDIEKIDLLKIDTEGKDYDIIIDYFKEPIVFPECIITEDIVKGNNTEPQLLIAEKKREFLISKGYHYSKVDDYNSKYEIQH